MISFGVDTETGHQKLMKLDTVVFDLFRNRLVIFLGVPLHATPCLTISGATKETHRVPTLLSE